ncbi:MAG: GDP-mannose 4,6-dehydratase [Gemmatimonadales bacterium]|nr:GDP-mannose 4,6-dehydratase [Gemmatimonadales bacterium]
MPQDGPPPDTGAGWRGRKVLVTGADGFIGSHLTEALLAAGAEVRAFCFYNSQGSLGWLDQLANAPGRVDVRLGDIRDPRYVESACEGMDVVFHLAALVAIPYSYVAPESFLETNVRGTLHVLEGVRRHRCARLVHTSTSEVYGTPDTLPITEGHPLKGQSPYSATKIAADKLCEAYFSSYDLPVVVLRPFNTYGPRQSARAVIPTILAQLLSGRTSVRLGSVAPRRDLTFVSDTVAGFLAAGLCPGVEGQTIQLGTGRSESIADVFRAACAACGVEARIETDPARVRPSQSEVMVLQSDPARAKEVLGWQATTSLEEGLAETARWVGANADRFRPDCYAV